MKLVSTETLFFFLVFLKIEIVNDFHGEKSYNPVSHRIILQYRQNDNLVICNEKNQLSKRLKFLETEIRISSTEQNFMVKHNQKLTMDIEQQKFVS